MDGWRVYSDVVALHCYLACVLFTHFTLRRSFTSLIHTSIEGELGVKLLNWVSLSLYLLLSTFETDLTKPGLYG